MSSGAASWEQNSALRLAGLRTRPRVHAEARRGSSASADRKTGLAARSRLGCLAKSGSRLSRKAAMPSASGGGLECAVAPNAAIADLEQFILPACRGRRQRRRGVAHPAAMRRRLRRSQRYRRRPAAAPDVDRGRRIGAPGNGSDAAVQRQHPFDHRRAQQRVAGRRRARRRCWPRAPQRRAPRRSARQQRAWKVAAARGQLAVGHDERAGCRAGCPKRDLERNCIQGAVERPGHGSHASRVRDRRRAPCR